MQPRLNPSSDPGLLERTQVYSRWSRQGYESFHNAHDGEDSSAKEVASSKVLLPNPGRFSAIIIEYPNKILKMLSSPVRW